LTGMNCMPSADCSYMRLGLHEPTGAFALHVTDNRMLLGYNGPHLKCTVTLTCQNSEGGLCRCLILAQLYCQLFASCLAVLIIAEVASINLNGIADLRPSDHAVNYAVCGRQSCYQTKQRALKAKKAPYSCIAEQPH